MKPALNIPAGMLENDDKFDNEFFNRFSLRHAPEPIKLTDEVSKNYRFPSFYGDVTCAMSICLCSYDRAVELVQKNLGEKVFPVKMPKNRAIVAFSCYEYKEVMGIPPYNEIAVAIPVMVNAKFRPPLLPMVLKSFNHFGYYIADMPVTSHENTLRGHNIWGLPKVTREITVDSSSDICTTTAMEEDGSPYLTVRVPKGGAPAEFDETGYLYSKFNGKVVRSKTSFKSTFNVTKNMDILFKKEITSDEEWITLGGGPSAEMLKDLNIEKKPFQFRYAEGMSSCFDLSDKNMPAWGQNL